MFGRRLTSDAFDRQFAQYACFVGAIVILLCGVKAVTRFATTEFEIVVGLLATGAVEISAVTLGIVAAAPRHIEANRCPHEIAVRGDGG